MGSPADSFGSAVDLNLISTIENASTQIVTMALRRCRLQNNLLDYVPKDHHAAEHVRRNAEEACASPTARGEREGGIEHEGEVLPDNEETIKGHGDARQGRFQCDHGIFLIDHQPNASKMPACDAARRDDRRLEQGLRARLHQVIIRNANVR